MIPLLCRTVNSWSKCGHIISFWHLGIWIYSSFWTQQLVRTPYTKIGPKIVIVNNNKMKIHIVLSKQNWSWSYKWSIITGNQHVSCSSSDLTYGTWNFIKIMRSMKEAISVYGVFGTVNIPKYEGPSLDFWADKDIQLLPQNVCCMNHQLYLKEKTKCSSMSWNLSIW